MLATHSYGKGRVRILRVDRSAEQHRVRELSLRVMLHGDFGAAYTSADNRTVIATDTIKNIVNMVARDHLVGSAETFCQAVADSFLARYPQVDHVEIASKETSWARLSTTGTPHPHCFVHDANGTPVTTLCADRASSVVRSGIAGFTFLKTTGSGWSGFVQDAYTTLPETEDRIAATSMEAEWGWRILPPDTDAIRATILNQMLHVFANSYSASLQDSLYRMGQAALGAAAAIDDIKLSCPNKHYLPIDLSSFGMASDNLVFTPTDEPHGQIECTIVR